MYVLIILICNHVPVRMCAYCNLECMLATSAYLCAHAAIMYKCAWLSCVHAAGNHVPVCVRACVHATIMYRCILLCVPWMAKEKSLCMHAWKHFHAFLNAHPDWIEWFPEDDDWCLASYYAMLRPWMHPAASGVTLYHHFQIKYIFNVLYRTYLRIEGSLYAWI